MRVRFLASLFFSADAEATETQATPAALRAAQKERKRTWQLE
jgi:hypothetical protein